jgi:site-specific DNA-methyltransferase (adenine-specific)
LHGVRDDLIVYDPFMGTGTTALACLKLNVNYLGTEVDEKYIKIARENIVQIKNFIERGRRTSMSKLGRL